MATSQLPERASLEYLKKLAKERLAELRRSDPKAKLAAALLDVAHEHGFPSWRALKEEVGRRRERVVLRFFTACATGDVEVVRARRQGSTAVYVPIRCRPHDREARLDA